MSTDVYQIPFVRKECIRDESDSTGSKIINIITAVVQDNWETKSNIEPLISQAIKKGSLNGVSVHRIGYGESTDEGALAEFAIDDVSRVEEVSSRVAKVIGSENFVKWVENSQ